MNLSTIIMITAIIFFVVIPTFKDREFSVKKLMISPAIFMYLFYDTIRENFIITPSSIGMITLGITAGIVLGALMNLMTPVKADKQLSLIKLPGSYLGLVVFLLIFSVHFIIGYVQATYHGYLTQPSQGEETLLFLISCVSSMTIGSNAMLFYKYSMSKPVNASA